MELVYKVRVSLDGRPLRHIKELEWAEGWVYANLWQQDTIVKIDPITGQVVALIDGSCLLPKEQRAQCDDLNGIAYDRHKRTFLLTGKYWPTLFEARFVAPSLSEEHTA
jgi:glutamine cyclotransferase